MVFDRLKGRRSITGNTFEHRAVAIFQMRTTLNQMVDHTDVSPGNNAL